jgi:hypothetical protein
LKNKNLPMKPTVLLCFLQVSKLDVLRGALN